MSAKVRQQQHRPAREGQKARELANLKRENHRLARANARLRKEATKAWGGVTLTPEVIEDASERTKANLGAPQLDIHAPDQCTQPGCGGLLRRVDLGRIVLMVCVVCKWRRPAAI
jgi:hypothetical protein